MNEQPLSLSRADRRKFEKAMRRAPRQQSAPQQPRTQQSNLQQSGGAQGGFGDFGDDDIPFLRHGHGAAWRAL